MPRGFTLLVLLSLGAYGAAAMALGAWNAPQARTSPFRDAAAEAELRDYFSFRPSKAFAASVTLSSWGWSYGYREPRAAERRAIAECEKAGEACLLYAVGDTVVWDAGRAEAALARIASSRRDRGALWRFYGEENPHGVPVVLPREAPSIISDYRSARGVMGRLRAKNPVVRPRHGGIDILGPVGAPVLAAADGVVLDAAFDEVAGLTVRIRHPGTGWDRDLITEYLHLEEALVEPGQRVARGAVIGSLGTTGQGAVPEQPHLHFEVAGANPHRVWHDGPGRVTCFDAGRRYAAGRPALTYPLPCTSLGTVLGTVLD